MSTLRKASESALKSLDELSCLGNGDIPGNSIGNCIAQDAAATLRAALAEPDEVMCTSDEWLANCPQSVRDLANKIKDEVLRGEPVAWRSWSSKGVGYWDTQDEAELNCDDGAEPEALYLHPARELTDEEIRDVWKEHGYKSNVCMKFALALIQKVRGL